MRYEIRRSTSRDSLHVGFVDAETRGEAISVALQSHPGLSALNMQLLETPTAPAAPAEPPRALAVSAPASAAPLRPNNGSDHSPRCVECGAVQTVPADCIVYDCETKLCIPNDREQRNPAWDYCRDRADWLGMGISVVCAIDLRDMIPRVFLADNLAAFAALIAGRVVAGHSNHEFDDKLVMAHGVPVTRSYDMLRHLRVAIGEPANYTPRVTRAGRRVNDIARENLNGLQKSADGAMAPVLWQEGKLGELVDYCLRDVMIEARLISLLPTLTDPLTRRIVTLPLPQDTPAP
jgi:hypothetical protein